MPDSPLLDFSQAPDQTEAKPEPLTLDFSQAPDQTAPVDFSQAPDQPAPDPGATVEDYAQAVNREWRGLSPDKAAELRRLSMQSGLGRGVVMRNLSKVKDIEGKKEAFSSIANLPRAAKYYGQNPDTFEISKDDMAALGKIEQTSTNSLKALSAGWLTMQRGFAGYAMLSGADNIDEIKGINAQIGDLRKEIPHEDLLDKAWFGALEMAPMMANGIGRGFIRGMEGAMYGAMGGSVIPGVGTTAGFFGGGSAGFNVGLAENAFWIEAGNAAADYLDLKDEQGQPLDKDTIRYAATIAGGMNALIETAQVGQLVSMFPGGDKLTGYFTRDGIKKLLKNPTTRGVVTDMAKKWIAAGATQTAEEAAQQFVTTMSGEIARDGFDPADFETAAAAAVGEAEAVAPAMFLLPLPGAMMYGASQAKIKDQIEADTQFINELADGAVNSKTLERDPDAFKKFVAFQLKDTPGENIYIAPKVFNEALSQAAPGEVGQIIEQLGLDRAAVADALSKGADVEIKTSNLVALANTPYFKPLVPHMKLNPLKMSAAEYQEAVSYAQEEVKKFQQAEAAAPVDEFGTMLEGLVQRHEAAGRSPEAARFEVALAEHRARTWADRSGRTPMEWFQRPGAGYDIRSAQEGVFGEGLDQTAGAETLSFANELVNFFEMSDEDQFESGGPDDIYEALAESLSDEYAVAELKQPDGSSILVHESTKPGGGWQVTTISKDGKPWGDTPVESKKEAMRLAVETSDPVALRDTLARSAKTGGPILEQSILDELIELGEFVEQMRQQKDAGTWREKAPEAVAEKAAEAKSARDIFHDSYPGRDAAAAWTDDRIKREISNFEHAAGNGKTRAQVAFVDPIDFILATTGEDPRWIEEEVGELDAVKLSSTEETPYLRINWNGEITGHEGRHRMLAMAKSGIKRAPVLLHYLDGEYKPRPYEKVKEFTGQVFSDADGLDITVQDAYPLELGSLRAIQNAMKADSARVLFQPATGIKDVPALDTENVTLAELTEHGKTFKTGEAVTFNFVHNPESATAFMGVPDKDAAYGRGYEPSGRYVTPVSEKGLVRAPENFVKGELTLENPLVVDNADLDWKKELSDAYGGLSGKDLSKALIRDGYDGVVTVDSPGKKNAHGSEILDLTTFDESLALYQGPRAQVIFPDGDGTPIIQLFEEADPSSFVHELAHIFFEDMKRSVADGSADAVTSTDLNTLFEWMNSELAGDKLTEQYDRYVRNQFFGGTAYAKLDEAQQIEATEILEHELFARGFEKYLREGKSPKAELEGVFYKFKQWLLDVYRAAKELDVTINKDVREVFDRLLATDEEIRAFKAQVALDEVLPESIADSEAEREVLRELINEARESSESAYQRAKDKATEAAKKQDSKIKKAAAAIVDQSKEMRLVKHLRSSKNKGLDRKEIKETYGAGMVDALSHHGRIWNTDGDLVGRVAENFGYDSADEMLRILSDTPSREDQIWKESEVIKAQLEAEPDLLSYFFTKERGKLIAAESRILARKNGMAPGKVTPTKTLRKAAAKHVAEMPLREATRIDKALAAVRRNATEAQRAIEAGEWGKAFEAKRLQLWAELELSERVKARDFRNAAPQKVRGWIKAKKVPERFKAHMLSIAKPLGLTARQVPEGIEPITALWDEIQAFFGEEYTLPPVPIWMTQPQESISYGEFVQSVEFINALGEIGKMYQDPKFDELDIAFADTMEKSLRDKKAIDSNSKAQQLARQYFADLDHLHFILLRASGYDQNSQLMQETWGRLKTANDDYKVLREKINNAVKPHLDHLVKKRKKLPSKLVFSDVGPLESYKQANVKFDWTFDKVVALALNMGNKTNIKRVVAGHWQGEKERAFSDLRAIFRETLDESDWDAIQGIWDSIEMLWPDMQKAYGDLYHMSPPREEAEAFTPPNVEKSYRGGYYPLVYDRALSLMVESWSEKEDLMNAMSGATGDVNIMDNFMKKRSGGAVALPIRLSLSVIDQHIAFASRYATHAKTVHDVNRIFKGARFRSQFVRKFGAEVYNRLFSALQYVARPGMTYKPDVFEYVGGKLRSLSTVAILGAKMSVMLKQAFSLPGFWKDVGFNAWVDGVLTMLDPVQEGGFILGSARDIKKLSPFMRNRDKSMYEDAGNALQMLRPDAKDIKGMTMKDLRDSMFIGIKLVDLMTTYPAWLGAYRKALTMYDGDNKKAVDYADNAIDKSQPTSDPLNMSEMQRNSVGLKRMFTMFGTFTIKRMNRMRYFYNAMRDEQISKTEYAHHVFLESVLPPILMNFMFYLLWAKWEDDEPEETMASMVYDIANYQFCGLPLVGDIAGATLSAAAAKCGMDTFSPRIGDSPMLQGGKTFSKALTSLGDIGEGFDEKDMWAVMDAVAYFAGIPAPRFIRDTKEGIRQFGESGWPGFLLVPNPKRRKK